MKLDLKYWNGYKAVPLKLWEAAPTHCIIKDSNIVHFILPMPNTHIHAPPMCVDLRSDHGIDHLLWSRFCIPPAFVSAWETGRR